MKISKLKLAIAMAQRDLHFNQLAELSGVSRATLSYINNGKSCKVEILLKIAKALGVEPKALLVDEA